MNRIDFTIYDELGKLINKMVKKYGFKSRADFFRYLAIDFIRKENEHDTKAIRKDQGREFI